MKIFVDSDLTHNNNPILLAIDIDPTDSIQNLKSKIAKRNHLKANDLTLTYGCKPLSDSQTLQSYGIKPDSTLQLNMRLRGGAQNKVSPKDAPAANQQKKQKQNRGVNLESVIQDMRKPKNLLPPNCRELKDLQNLFNERSFAKQNRITTGGNWELGRHGDTVASVSVSGDNRYVVSGSVDNTIKIFDLETKQEVYTIENAHTDSVNQVVATKDNKYIVSCSDDGAIKVFDFETRKEVRCFANAHKERIKALAVSHDSKYIVSGSKDQAIKVFDLNKKEQDGLVCQFVNAHGVQQDDIRNIAISRDNKYIVSGGHDACLKLFDISQQKEIYKWERAHKFEVSAVAISSDNKYIISSGWDGIVKIYDFDSKEVVFSFKDENTRRAMLKVYKYRISALAISDNNKYLVTASEEGSVKVFDLEMKRLIHDFQKVHQEPITSIVLSEKNEYIVTSSWDKTVRVFELEIPVETHHFPKVHPNIVTSVALSSDSKYMVSGSWDKSIKIFDLELKKEVHCIQDAHSENVMSVAISNDNNYIASCSADKSFKLFNLKTQEEIFCLPNAHENTMGDLVFSSDDRYLITSSYNGVIKVFELSSKRELYKVQHRTKNLIHSVCVSRDNKYIAAGYECGDINIYDLETGREVSLLQKAHQQSINSVRISHDSKRVISASRDQSIKIFDIHSQEELYSFDNAHEGEVLALDITKDGTYIVSGDSNKSIKIFSLETMQEVYHFKNAHLNAISDICISNDKKRFAASSYNGSIKVFNFPFSDENWVFPRSANIPAYLSVGNYEALLLNVANDDVRNQNMLEYRDLCFIPYNWTILHLMAIFEPANISKMPSYSDLQVPFLLDTYKKTPLHYLLAQDSIDYSAVNAMLKYILDYVEDTTRSQYEYNSVFTSLSVLFPFIISKTNPVLRDRFLELSFNEPGHVYNKLVPRFGQDKTERCLNDSPTLTPDAENKIYKKGDIQVSFSAVKLNFNYGLLSDDMLNNTIALLEENDENIFKSRTVSCLIEHLWGISWRFHFVMSVLFTALMLLMSIYIGLGERDLGMEIAMLVLCVFFMVSEYLQLFKQRMRYFSSVWNWADLAFFKIFIATIITRFTDNEDELTRGWLFATIIILGYLRWISYLRLFSPTRNLIRIILVILQDMWSFVLILVFIIVGYSLIFLEFNRDNDYLTHLYATYNILYGDMDYSEYSASQKILLATVTFFLSVVLLNLLIAIMGNSYERVKEEHILTDSHSKLEMILESTLLLRIFLNKGADKKGYILLCEPDSGENTGKDKENEIQVLKDMLKQSNNRVNQVSGTIKALEKRIEERVKGVEQKIEANQNEILSLIKEFSKRT